MSIPLGIGTFVFAAVAAVGVMARSGNLLLALGAGVGVAWALRMII